MRNTFANYNDRIKRYFPFQKEEMRNIVATILIIGFMYGFNDNSSSFNLTNWTLNLIISIAISAITVLVFVVGQRLIGIYNGYQIEFQMWWPGLILALIVTFISRGYIWIPIAGGMLVHFHKGHRLGYFRYGLNLLSTGMTAAAGPIACILFATIIKQINLLFSPVTLPIIQKLYWFSLIFALVNMLPIPPLAGSKLLFNARLPYVFIFSFMLAYTALAFFEFYSWIIALIISFILWLIFYIKCEHSLDKGRNTL
jgi:hypothetical protein